MRACSLEDAITELDSPKFEEALDRRCAILEKTNKLNRKGRVITLAILFAAVLTLSILLIAFFANRVSDPFSRIAWPAQYAENDAGIGYAKTASFGRVKFVKEDNDQIVLKIEKSNDEPICFHMRGINVDDPSKSKWGIASGGELSHLSGYEVLNGALEFSLEGEPIKALPSAEGLYTVTVNCSAFIEAGYRPYDFAVGTEKDQLFFLLGAEKRFIGESYKKGIYVDLTTIYSEMRDETSFRLTLSIDPSWTDYDKSLGKILFSCADGLFVSGRAFGRELEKVKLDGKNYLLFDPTLPGVEYREEVRIILTVKGRIEKDKYYSFDLYNSGTEEEDADILRFYVNSIDYRDYYDVFSKIEDLVGADILCLPNLENAIPISQVVCSRNADAEKSEKPSVDDYDRIVIDYKLQGNDRYKKYVYTISKTNLLPEGGETSIIEHNDIRFTVYKNVEFGNASSLYYEKDGYYYCLKAEGWNDFDAESLVRAFDL